MRRKRAIKKNETKKISRHASKDSLQEMTFAHKETFKNLIRVEQNHHFTCLFHPMWGKNKAIGD